MTIEKVFQVLFPYLSSFRKVEKYVSMDLIFPKGWEFPNELISQVQVVQNEKYNGEGTFLMFVCEVQNNMDSTLSTIFDIINHNLEREEKERLLRKKVSELKELFANTQLSDLQNLKIQLPEPDPIEDYIEDSIEDEEV